MRIMRLLIILALTAIVLCSDALAAEHTTPAPALSPDPEEETIALPGFVLYVGSARAADDALEAMPIDLIRAVSPMGDGRYCAVIPADWDAAALRVYFTEEKTLTVGDRRCRSGDTVAFVLGEPVAVTPEEGPGMVLSIHQTGGLPVLWMVTESGSDEYIHAAKGNRETGWLRFVETDGRIAYDGALTQIKGRGNSTFNYEKKPYQIKLARRTALAGTAPDKTWVLLANMLDRAEIRNTMALDMARYAGVWRFVPACRSVDVYLNRDYKGTYLLCEKVGIDKGRLDITDLESATKKMNPDVDYEALTPLGPQRYTRGGRRYYLLDREPEDLTGGYLVRWEVGKRFHTEASSFVTNRGATFIPQSPKYCTKHQIDYLADLFNVIERTIYDPTGTYQGRDYTALIDLTTFAHRYVLAEVVDDYDGQRSNYYKDSDTVDPLVYAGPVWDQDNTWGVALYNDPSLLHIHSGSEMPFWWFHQLQKHRTFTEAAEAAYRETYLPAQRILLGEEKDPGGPLRSIDEYAAEVRQSAMCDAVRWPYPLRNAIRNINTETGDDFDAQIDFLKGYITARMPVLNDHFGVAYDTEDEPLQGEDGSAVPGE